MGITRRKLFGITLGAGFGVFSNTRAAKLLEPTPDEIEGPFYPVVEQQDTDFDLSQIKGHSEKASGEIIHIKGKVIDQNGRIIPDVHLEIWQANSHGRYRHPSDSSDRPLDPHFQGWSILKTGADGQFKFTTIMPGAYAVNSNWNRPPHIHFKVTKPGFAGLITQMYFADQPLNDVDLLIQNKKPSEQKAMIANKDKDKVYLYDIVMVSI